MTAEKTNSKTESPGFGPGLSRLGESIRLSVVKVLTLQPIRDCRAFYLKEVLSMQELLYEMRNYETHVKHYLSVSLLRNPVPSWLKFPCGNSSSSLGIQGAVEKV